MSDIKSTGWVRYNICGRGGSGFETDHWVYIPGYDDPIQEDTREHIINNYESWAIYAEQYHIDFHYGELPPREKIEAVIEGKHRYREVLLEEIVQLEAQLKGVS